MKTRTNTTFRDDDIEKAFDRSFDPALYMDIFESDKAGTSSKAAPEVLLTHDEDYLLRSMLPTPTATRSYSVDDNRVLYEKVDGLRKALVETAAYIYQKQIYIKTFSTESEDLSVRDVIKKFENLPEIDYRERLADRLQLLYNVSQEELPAQAPMARESMESFFAFFSSNPDLAYPSVVLTPDGNVRARWKGDSSQYLAIEFFEDNNVRYVLSAYDPKHSYKMNRTAGSATTDSVLDVVEPYGVLVWVKERRLPLVI